MSIRTSLCMILLLFPLASIARSQPQLPRSTVKTSAAVGPDEAIRVAPNCQSGCYKKQRSRA